jgi:hypothetical protein
MIQRLHINKFWDDEYKNLNYIREPFNDADSLAQWTTQGYTGPFTGAMCDMRYPQPSWNQRFIDYFSAKGWKDIGTSYYRMDTSTILPVHSDLYTRYIELFDLKGREHWIHRAIVFLEDWQSGHYIEVDGEAVTNWRAGDTFAWRYDAPHMAANIGLLPRYTLQITGHL